MSNDESPEDTPPESPSSSASLAEQLDELDVEAETRASDETRPESSEADRTGPVEGEGLEDDESPKGGAERFREAVDGLSREEMERRKYDLEDDDRATMDEAIDGSLADLEVSDSNEGSSDVTEGDRRISTDARERLASAVDEMSADEMERRKFQDGLDEEESSPDARRDVRSTVDDDTPTNRKARPTSDEAARTELEQRHREESRHFEDAMRDVDPIERSNYRSRETPDPEAFLEGSKEPRDEESSSPNFVTPTLDKQGEGLNRVSPLDASQRAMHDRFELWAESWPVPELNVRGATVDEALDRLDAFVDRCWREGDRFARIVPGRGLRSEGSPVLKPAVLTWLEEEGNRYLEGYIPERSIEGDYGSLIVEFVTDGDGSTSPD
jgi:DNA-nicking Smr family endonuclease